MKYHLYIINDEIIASYSIDENLQIFDFYN